MGPQQLRRLDQDDPRNSIHKRIASIARFLWDEGPSRSVEIAEAIGLSQCRVAEILQIARADRTVDIIRRGVRIYWMLSDHIEINSNGEIQEIIKS